MSTSSITIQDLNSLRNLITDFSAEGKEMKSKLLRNFGFRSIRKPALMLRYQELLLFLAAYPDSQELMLAANSELERLNQTSTTILKDAKESVSITFSGSGFASSYFIGSFSFAICNWLEQSFPESSAFHSYGDSEKSSQELLGLSLLPSEIWLQENLDFPVKKWTREACGQADARALPWILQAMKHEDLPVSIRDLLFDSLQLYISFDLLDKKNALSLLRTPKGTYFFSSTPLLKRVSINEILNKN